jgi:hypothetical protein
MGSHPFQVTLIDSSRSPGGGAELGVLSADFPGDPPRGLTIYDVSWVRSESTPGPDPCRRHRVGYRSISPITSGFLRYLDHVLTHPYAARRLAVQPLG